ncbi:MAG: PP0621 family protein [Halothiobacillus sp.]
MGKLLFWVVVILGLAGYVAYRLRGRPAPKQNGRRPVQTLNSVRCAQCGVYLPVEQSVKRDGQSFCCWEHAQKWHDQHPS